MSFSKTPQTPEAREREAQSKFIEEAVQKVQKYFGLMCNEIGGICRKNGRLRDKYDDFAKTCMEYANVEQGPLKTKLTNFSENISAIQDYRQAQIERIEGKVLTPLTTYGRECKHTQNDLNTSFKARNRELKQHQQVEALRNKSPHDRHTITQAEAELQRRTVDVAQTTQILAKTIDKFETKKIKDLKMFRNNLRPATAMNERLDIAQSINPGANDKNRPVTTMERTRLTFQDSNRHEREQGRSEEEEEEEESEEEEEYDSEENDDDDYEDEEDEVEELKTPQPRRVRTKPW